MLTRFAIAGTLALSLPATQAVANYVSVMTNHLDSICYLTVMGPGISLRNVTLDPGESYEMNFRRDADGRPDMQFCRSTYRVAGDCPAEVARGYAEGCFPLAEQIGCPGDPNAEEVIACW